MQTAGRFTDHFGDRRFRYWAECASFANEDGLTRLTKLTMIYPFILFMAGKKEEISSRELRKHEE